MNVYVSDIVTTAAAFPLVAAVLTLPYLIVQYRRLGSVPWLGALAVYSFVFYLMCAYFLVLLPLPADHSAYVAYAARPQLTPFSFVHDIAVSTSIKLGEPATWLQAATNPFVYEAFFNVLLLVPLGMYLRYYFRRTWWQTLLIGCAVTLSFELSQLTGLWGIYEHPYRLFDVDDLITNAFGAMVGFWLAGPLMRALPDVRLVNEEARRAGAYASALRRALSFLLDAAVFAALAGAVGLAYVAATPGGVASPAGLAFAVAKTPAPFALMWFLVWLAVFSGVPVALRGATLGQKVLHLRVVTPDAKPAPWYRVAARYGLLFAFLALFAAALLFVLTAGYAYGGELGAVSRFVGANRAFFLGARERGRGRHRARSNERRAEAAARSGRGRGLPRKAKDAPFALAVDVPSGLSAQTGACARPCFAADMTVTMLAYKPGLVTPAARAWTGAVTPDKLVNTAPYLAQLEKAAE